MKTSWHTSAVSSHEVGTCPPGMPWKAYLGETCPHGLEVALVDGTFVRCRFDSDFSQGGNGYRYNFVPRNEIWIDRQIAEVEWPYIGFHECSEVELLRRGASYSRAHDQSKAQEDLLRKRYLTPCFRGGML